MTIVSRSAAALGVALLAAGAVAAIGPDPATVPKALAAAVRPAAVITPGTATNWNADGIDRFFGVDWNAQYGPTVVAPFHLLRDWVQIDDIDDAVRANPQPNLVLTSGRGSGNASALITSYARTGNPVLQQTEWILDNNIGRPNGGYASRLPFFSLVVVNPHPTPTDTGADIIDVGYQYAWNSNVPLYVSNVVALLNSITEYAYRYGKQSSVTLPPGVLEPDAAPGHYIVGRDGAVRFEQLSATNTTRYVSYESAGLALLRPLRDHGGLPGRVIADLVEPALTVIVDAGYPDNTPLSPPDVYTPMRLLPPPKVIATAVRQLPAAIGEGIAAARADLVKACAPAVSAGRSVTKQAQARKATAPSAVTRATVRRNHRS